MPDQELPLRLDDVTVKLGGTPIVRNVSFDLGQGELALLTGLNGAGKSTLLRAVVNLLPSDGDIRIRGHLPSSPESRSHFQFVPDEAALYEDLTLQEHVTFVSTLYSQPDAPERIVRWLTAFRLEHRIGEFPATHSRGMRQKLSLSLALGIDTALLVLDEPYNGLDADAQVLLNDALQERCRNGGAVLLTGHQGELLDRLGARHLHLEDGLIR